MRTRRPTTTRRATSRAVAAINARLAQTVAAHHAGSLAVAQAGYEEILSIRPEHVEALYMLGIIAFQCSDAQKGIDIMRRVIRIDPGHAPAHDAMGTGLAQLGRLDEALASYDRAIAVDPDFAAAHANRGNVLQDLRRLDEALASYDRAIALDLNCASAHCGRGGTLEALGRPEEALASLDRSIALSPGLVEAYMNRGNSLYALSRVHEALAWYARALAIQSEHADSHLAEGMCRLAMGDFELGWEKYEWRRRGRTHASPAPMDGRPPWLGREALQGKTILLHAEQGLGDTIQFCRYAALVARRGATVLLQVQPALKELLSTLHGVSTVVAGNETLPQFDFHAPLLSLPHAFRTRLDTVPADVPYLVPDQERAARWRHRLGSGQAPRIGLVWAGTPTHRNDRNRSLSAARLIEAIPSRVMCYSLQKDLRAADRDLLRQRTDITHFGDELVDFSDTAALVSLMDVVISVDTSVAHLAGALGKDVWVLLPFAPDWRWMLNRADSPWYPTARLFRQPAVGDWDAVLSAIRRELVRLSAR